MGGQVELVRDEILETDPEVDCRLAGRGRWRLTACGYQQMAAAAGADRRHAHESDDNNALGQAEAALACSAQACQWISRINMNNTKLPTFSPLSVLFRQVESLFRQVGSLIRQSLRSQLSGNHVQSRRAERTDSSVLFSSASSRGL